MILMVLEVSDLGSGQYELPARGPAFRDRRGCWVVVLLGCQAGSGICRRRVNALARASAQGQCSARRRNTLRWPCVMRAATCSSR